MNGWAGLLAIVLMTTVGVLVAAFEALQHWMVFPVLICGVLITNEVALWIRDRDPLRLRGLVGLYLLHFFVVCPLAHPVVEFYWPYRWAPDDWRHYLGVMASLNAVGLTFYRLVLFKFGTASSATAPPAGLTYDVSEKRIRALGGMALLLAGAAQVFIFSQFGGVQGVIEAHEARLGAGAGANPFVGYGLLTLLSESAPTVLLVTMIFGFPDLLRRSLTARVVVLLVVFGLLVLFSGIRGSRASVVWGGLWALGMYHYFIAPVRKKHLMVGALATFLFMNVFFFYKRGGWEGLVGALDPVTRSEVVERAGTGNDLAFIALHDFGRADIQALVAYRLMHDDDFELARGSTYVGSILGLVPRGLWEDRPDSVREKRTELLYGSSHYAAEGHFIPWIFGGAGEFAINFGWVFIPFFYLFYGFLVAVLDRFALRWSAARDVRRVFCSLFISLAIMGVMVDSHIIAYALVKMALVTVAVIALSMKRVQRHRGLLQT